MSEGQTSVEKATGTSETTVLPHHESLKFDSLDHVWEYVEYEPEAVAIFRDETGGGERIMEHAWRTTANLYAFGNGRVDKATFRAAMLHDVAQKVHDPLVGIYATQAMQGYWDRLTDTGDPERDKIFAVLADLDEVEEVSEYARFGEHACPEYQVVLQSHKDIAVPTELWSEPVKIVSSRHIKNLEHTVAPQAVIIKAVEMLDNLTHRPPSDRALLQDVYDTLSFYVPWCSAKGYDALESALVNRAESWMLRKAGNTSELNKASVRRAELGSDEQIIEAAQLVINALTHRRVPLRSVIPRDTHNHEMLFATGRMTLGSGEELKIVFRRKSDASTANLAIRHPEFGRDFPDLCGMTIIEPNDEAALVTFAGLVGAFREFARSGNNELALKPAKSPKRKESIQVSGTKKHSRRVREHLRRAGMTEDDISAEVDFPGYPITAAKIALHATIEDSDGITRTRPFEIMVMSRYSRKGYRVGEESHIGYKRKGEIRPKDLKSMNRKRHSLLDINPTVPTKLRTAKLLESIDRK